MAEENDSNQNRRGNRPPAGALVPAGAIPMPPGPYDPYAYPPEYLMAAEEGKHLREYWLILIRRKWVALAVLAVALAVAVAYVWHKTPLYLAATQIELESQSENILPYDQILGGGASNYDEYVETQIRHITSRTLAARVVETLGLDRDDVPDPFIEQKTTGMLAGWLSMGRHYTPAAPGAAGAWSPEEKKQAAIDKLLKNLTVTPERNSRVVELSYLSRNPERAARIVNTICAEYIQYNFQAKFDATTRATDFLQKQLVDLKSKVESSDNELIDYARKHSIVSLGEKQDVITQALGDINAQLTEARALRMAKESVYRTIAQTTPDDFPQALRTPLIEKIEAGLLNDEQELARLSAQLGPAMPQVKQLESRVGRAREQLRHERGLAIANARAEYETALDTENRLSQAFDGQKKLADQMSEAGIHYNILKREAETNKELYDGLLQRMKEAGGRRAEIEQHPHRGPGRDPQAPPQPEHPPDAGARPAPGGDGRGGACLLPRLPRQQPENARGYRRAGGPAVPRPDPEPAVGAGGVRPPAQGGPLRGARGAGGGAGGAHRRQQPDRRSLPRRAHGPAPFHPGQPPENHHGHLLQGGGGEDHDDVQHRPQSRPDGQAGAGGRLRHAPAAHPQDLQHPGELGPERIPDRPGGPRRRGGREPGARPLRGPRGDDAAQPGNSSVRSGCRTPWRGRPTPSTSFFSTPRR